MCSDTHTYLYYKRMKKKERFYLYAVKKQTKNWQLKNKRVENVITIATPTKCIKLKRCKLTSAKKCICATCVRDK